MIHKAREGVRRAHTSVCNRQASEQQHSEACKRQAGCAGFFRQDKALKERGAECTGVHEHRSD